MRAPDPGDGEGEDLFRTEHASSAEAAQALAQRLREEESPPATVDVRGADAYQRLRVEGALHCPLDDLEEAADDLPRERLLYVYGEDHASGAASRVTLLLAQDGFRVQEVHGGLAALREAGAPLAGEEAPSRG